ncbi:IS110 family transposase [Pleomorphomonas oryzae]|uniref:IS110 family transposase n=1 Tax=Pleomorphomonas oryzae TaxID=261934 RepID=UPI0003FBEEF9|nr:IS110 family transposase [Pleomorphomonas oryzae]
MAFLQHAPDIVLGFDVSKDTLTVFEARSSSSTAKPCVIDNSAAAIRRFLKGIERGDLAVCEPTGGHEHVLLVKLMAAGIACHRVDALKVKAFIRSFGTLAKTDALDAEALARYGKDRWEHLSLFLPPEADRKMLTDLVARREDLVAMKVAEQNRAKGPAGKVIKTSCATMLRTIIGQIETIEAEIESLIDKSPQLRAAFREMQSLPGVGTITAAALLAHMPELGTLQRRQAASLAGVAPHANDSGQFRGHRTMRGGRSEVRRLLFLAALAASRAKGPLRDAYQRLIQNGKRPIVAIGALMRKIIVILNARLRDLSAQQS